MLAAAIQTDIRRVTLEEYFEFEFTSPTKHEYINGQIIPMPYTSDNHGLIALNIAHEIKNAIKNKNFRAYAGDRMVYSPFCNDNFYPDVVVVQGEPEHYDFKGKMKATLNPVVLVEVLSDSTENLDKNEKWSCYREIKSLKQYFLISQHEPHIEFYTRVDDSNRWVYTYVRGLDEKLSVAGFDISLKDIYDLVNWQAEPKTEAT
ncbi:MAG: Uma2 family endonuclease [Saprospiraceae bacterium]